MPEATRIAVVGAESTGKTALAQALADHLSATSGLTVTWVPEVLREWCVHHGRTPRVDEQLHIAREQHARIERAAERHAVVVCDTTALMTSVYSRLIFGDDSLEAPAIAWHRAIRLTLLTALDLPWVADGTMRDGPHVREPVDREVRRLLATHALPWALVQGSGAQRLQSALAAVRPCLPCLPCLPGGAGPAVRG